MPFSRDLRPIIGKVLRVEGVFVLTGLGSAGFEQGAIAGRFLAECVHEGRGSAVLLEAEPGG